MTKYGEVYMGLEIKTKIMLVYPLIFIVKRLLFTFIAMYMSKSITFQL
jgi:hypothetical protein